jgi:hypothetical protein
LKDLNSKASKACSFHLAVHHRDAPHEKRLPAVCLLSF